jgi:hypothetical protein
MQVAMAPGDAFAAVAISYFLCYRNFFATREGLRTVAAAGRPPAMRTPLLNIEVVVTRILLGPTIEQRAHLRSNSPAIALTWLRA